MKAPSPAFSFYPKDIASDIHCQAMTHAEFGMYIRLLGHAWMEGSIPADPVRLQRILKVSSKTFRSCWPAIEPCWTVDGDRLVQMRLEEERDRQRERSLIAASNARKSVSVRKSTKAPEQRLSETRANGEQNASFPSPSPSASPNDRDKPCVSETRTHAREGMLLDEIPCPACQRAGHLSQSPGRKGNPPGFWCHRDRGGCGQNYPLDYAEIVDRMTPGARRAILAQAAIAAPAAPSGQGRRRAPSWDQPDAFEGDLSAKADAWIAVQWPSGIVRSREELLDLLGTLSPPDEIRGAVHMALFARNPHLREVSA